MIVAAGGFHPLFVDVPRGVPATMDRLGFGLKLGRGLSMEMKLYYAVTPNARHLGVNVELKAKLGPVTIEGFLGFDALVNTETDRFSALVRFGVAVKYKGKSLCGVKVDMVLDGPDMWHAVGKGSFEILWWDVDFDFDERWGDAEQLSTVSTPLREELAAQLSVESNWAARLPAGLAPPITVEPPPTGLAVHPLGELVFLQRLAPLGIEISRVGAKRVAGGPVTFSVESATVGPPEGATPVAPRPATTTPVLEHFARGQFVELAEEARLATPAFERFDAGVAIGAGGFRVPGTSGLGRAPLTFEDRYLVPEDEPLPDPEPRRRRWHIELAETRISPSLETTRFQALTGPAATLGADGRGPCGPATAGSGRRSARRRWRSWPPRTSVRSTVTRRASPRSRQPTQARRATPGTVLVEAFELEEEVR